MRGFKVLVVIEALTLLSFTSVYMASKGLLLMLGVLFILSSLAYAALVACLRVILDRTPLRGVAFPSGLALAGILHSAILYLVVSSYHRELFTVWEILAVVLDVSNIYGFAAIGFSDIDVNNNLWIYTPVNAATLALVPWIYLRFLVKREPKGFYETFREVAVATALCVKPAEYLILTAWLVTLF